MTRKELLKMAFVACGAMMLACASPVSRAEAAVLQDDTQLKEVPNPEKAAKKRTGELKKTLGLTDKQYKKMYKLILKEENEKYEMATNRPQGGMRGGPGGGGMPPGGGGGMMGGGPGGGMGGGMMGGGPGGGMGPGGGGGMPPQGMGSSQNKDPRAEIEKREKKIRKILTEEQYAMYQEIRAKEMEQQRPPMGPQQEGQQPEGPGE